jgi:hypothetical protein|tara:strand:- start:830 stop:1084 length:255 start_codon:yes stop_codon:yes gene_type:complete
MTTQASKPYQPLAWTGTTVLLTAAILISAFPNEMYGVYGFFFASIIWTVVGILWKEKSLIVLNGVLSLIYTYGVTNHLISYFAG